jgi:hypothetical protein
MNFNIYEGMDRYKAKLPPFIPVGEDAAENPDKEGSGEQNPAATNWTVFSPNVLRGPLDKDTDYRLQ